MKSREDAVPRALRDVWKWKETVHRDMAGLTTAEALKRFHVEAEALCRAYGISRAIPDEGRLRVAEDRAGFGRSNGATGNTRE